MGIRILPSAHPGKTTFAVHFIPICNTIILPKNQGVLHQVLQAVFPGRPAQAPKSVTVTPTPQADGNRDFRFFSITNANYLQAYLDSKTGVTSVTLLQKPSDQVLYTS